MKYPDIIGSSDKKFRNYSYGKRPGKKLVKYSPTKAKINKLKSSLKNISLKKGVVKGIKFGAKVATSPISLGLAGGALAVNPLTLAFGAGAGIIKIGKTKSFDFPKNRQFDRKGRKI